VEEKLSAEANMNPKSQIPLR